MSDCPTCGNHSWLCQQCKMEALEDRHGTASDHFETAADVDDQDNRDELEYCCTNCGHEYTATGSSPCPECGARQRRYIGPLPGETENDEVETEQAITDGGTITEGELVDRAVREAADLVDAGDSTTVAVDYVCGVHDLAHRRDDVFERVFGRLELEVATDGGRNPEDLVVLICEPCEYQTVAAAGARSITSCPDCQGDLEVDDDHVAHKCPAATDVNHVTVVAGERCPFCQTIQQQIATDGGIDVDLDAIREEVSFFLRRSNSGGAKAALHLPTEDATREDPAVRCKYNNREGVAFRPQELDATPDWQLIKRGCSECFGTATRPTDEQCGRKPSDVLEEAGFDVVTDGGRDLEGRQAFLAGDRDERLCEDCEHTLKIRARADGVHCPNCDGRGEFIDCIDDLCHAQGECFHDGNVQCSLCEGSGKVSPATRNEYWGDRLADRRAQLTPLKTVSLLGVVAMAFWFILAIHGVIA